MTEKIDENINENMVGKNTKKEITPIRIHKNITENADSLEIGSASKGGKVKVYGDFNSPEDFKDKLAKAKLVRDYANANICVNV